jgi:hypothetical protein
LLEANRWASVSKLSSLRVSTRKSVCVTHLDEVANREAEEIEVSNAAIWLAIDKVISNIGKYRMLVEDGDWPLLIGSCALDWGNYPLRQYSVACWLKD